MGMDNVETVFSFYAKADVCSIVDKRIELTEDPSNLLRRLEDGEGLLDVLGVDADFLNKFPLAFAHFDGIESVSVGEKVFYSGEGYVRKGRVLLPYDRVLSRDKVIGSFWDARRSGKRAISERYNDLLMQNSDAESFYKVKCGQYLPVDSGVLVLGEEQFARGL